MAEIRRGIKKVALLLALICTHALLIYNHPYFPLAARLQPLSSLLYRQLLPHLLLSFHLTMAADFIGGLGNIQRLNRIFDMIVE